MKHIFILAKNIIALLIMGPFCLLSGAICWLWDFRKKSFSDGLRIPDQITNWTKLLTMIMLVIFTSCSSGSSRRLTIVKDSVNVMQKSKANMLQVMHMDGRVENIPDTLRMYPKVGDTIVIQDFWEEQPDSTYIGGRVIYGKYIHGRMPENWDEDSSFAVYSPVVVQRVIIGY